MVIKVKTVLVTIMFTLATYLPTAQAAEVKKADSLPENGLSVAVGLEYSSGDYGTVNTTDTWTIPLDLSYTKDDLYFGVNTSYISANSSGNVIISSSSMHTRMLTTTTTTTHTSVSGLGDVNLYAGYLFPVQADTRYRLTAQLKLPTADEAKGLGTGEIDFSVEAGMLTRLEGTKRFFAGIGYQISGDSATTDYDNVVFGHAGISTQYKSGQRMGLMLEYAQTATPGFDDALELTGFFDMGMNNNDNLHFYALLGLTDGSPDFGAGIQYRHNL
jgi:hypothetical protein